MVWRTVNNTDAGTSTTFGGNDLDKFSRLYNGEQEVDPVDINTRWQYRDNKLNFANPLNTFTYKIRTAALNTNVDVAFPLISGNDEFVLRDAVQAANMKNKVISASQNTLPYVRKSPSVAKSGTIACASATEQGDGLLWGYTKYQTPAFSTDFNGSFVRYSTGPASDTTAGIQSLTPIVRREYNPRLKVRFSTNALTTNMRLLIGFASMQTMPSSDTPFTAADWGLLFGFSSADTTNFRIWASDGFGSTTTTFNVSTSLNTKIHNIELRMDDALATMYYNIDDAASDNGLVSEMPSTNRDMYVYAIVQNTTGNSRDLDLRYVDLECIR
jgi:hypothetical protein